MEDHDASCPCALHDSGVGQTLQVIKYSRLESKKTSVYIEVDLHIGALCLYEDSEQTIIHNSVLTPSHFCLGIGV